VDPRFKESHIWIITNPRLFKKNSLRHQIVEYSSVYEFLYTLVHETNKMHMITFPL